MADLSFRVITPQPNARRRFDQWWFQHATTKWCWHHSRSVPWFARWVVAPSPGPTIGRKRRSRRARGRRIEARRNPPYVNGRIWLASAGRMLHSKPIGPTTRLGNVAIPTCIDDIFLDPPLGEPWEDQADG